MKSLVHPKYRPDIDGLRAIAVLSVIVFHAFPRVLRGGFVGVDVFFVISGFLISNILFESIDQNQFSFRQFYSRRIKRIFPALILVLLACLAAGRLLLLPDEYRRLGSQVAAGAAFASNILFWTQSGYFDTAADTKPLLHFWSLGIEEQYYLVWPCLAALMYKLRSGRWGLLGVVFWTSFLINIYQTYHNPVAAFYLPFSRMWELALGASLSYLIVCSRQSEVAGNIARRLTGNVSSLAGVLLIGIAISIISGQAAFPGWWALLPTVGTALVIAAGPTAWANRYILSRRSVVFVGLISYPLYLWHWPLLSFGRIFYSGQPKFPVMVLLLITTFLLAWLTYWLIERPVRKSKKFIVPVWLAGAVAALGILGFIAYQTNGLAASRGINIAAVPDAGKTGASPSIDTSSSSSTERDRDEKQEAQLTPKSTIEQTPRSLTDEKPHRNAPAVTGSPTRNQPADESVDSAASGESTPSNSPTRATTPKLTPEQIYARQLEEFMWVEKSGNLDPSCVARYHMDSYWDNKCKIYDPQREPTAALIGDSHANAMYPGFAKYFGRRKGNLVNLGRGGCPPFWDVRTKATDVECHDFMNSILDAALNTPSIRVILLADFTDLYLEGNVRTLVSTTSPSEHPGEETYIEEFQKTAAKFQAAGKRVVVVMDYPYPAIDPKSCISRPLAGAPERPVCAVPQSVIDERAALSRKIKRAVIRGMPSLDSVDISNAYCDGVNCWVMKDDVLLYRDGDHLSLDGSLFFEPFIKISHGVPPGQ